MYRAASSRIVVDGRRRISRGRVKAPDKGNPKTREIRIPPRVAFVASCALVGCGETRARSRVLGKEAAPRVATEPHRPRDPTMVAFCDFTSTSTILNITNAQISAPHTDRLWVSRSWPHANKYMATSDRPGRTSKHAEMMKLTHQYCAPNMGTCYLPWQTIANP